MPRVKQGSPTPTRRAPRCARLMGHKATTTTRNSFMGKQPWQPRSMLLGAALASRGVLHVQPRNRATSARAGKEPPKCSFHR